MARTTEYKAALAHADRYMREGEARVVRQIFRIGELDAEGRDIEAVRARQLLAKVTGALTLARQRLRAAR